MTKAETENLAKRYIRYLGVELRTKDIREPFSILVGGFVFMSYAGFLFGGNAIPGADGFCEKSYNELVIKSFDPSFAPCRRTLEYSSAEELDFKMSVAGF